MIEHLGLKMHCDKCDEEFVCFPPAEKTYALRREAERAGWAETKVNNKHIHDLCPKCFAAMTGEEQ
jgi:hypothetical protein